MVKSANKYATTTTTNYCNISYLKFFKFIWLAKTLNATTDSVCLVKAVKTTPKIIATTISNNEVNKLKENSIKKKTKVFINHIKNKNNITDKMNTNFNISSIDYDYRSVSVFLTIFFGCSFSFAFSM